MIETAESRQQFEQRREKAQAALRCAVRGELPLESNIQAAVVPVRQEQAKKSKFDKRSYQREYMRKRRCKASPQP